MNKFKLCSNIYPLKNVQNYLLNKALNSIDLDLCSKSYSLKDQLDYALNKAIGSTHLTLFNRYLVLVHRGAIVYG